MGLGLHNCSLPHGLFIYRHAMCLFQAMGLVFGRGLGLCGLRADCYGVQAHSVHVKLDIET